MNLKNYFKSFLMLMVFCQVSSLTFAQNQTELDAAIAFLKENQKELQLSDSDIDNAHLNDFYKSQHNGLTHIYLNQTFEGVKIAQAIININILPNGEVLHYGNKFIPNLAQKINGSTPTLEPQIALAKIMERFELETIQVPPLKELVNEQHFIYEPAGIALEPIVIKLVYAKESEDKVRLAWQVELYELDAKHWWNAKVDAQTGDLILIDDQVIHCDFNESGEFCVEHGHVHTTHSVKKTTKTKTASSAIMANSYNVFPLEVESPNHGGRELVTAPANDIASPFGWHDTDGVDGHEYTITRGNNVHAYHDIYNFNTSVGDEPDGGNSLDFDFPLDLSSGLPYSQVNPAIVNLFYWNNTLHDLWYQYGFDEVSGNFQANNYGNGGLDGDYVRAEGLDGGFTNNAFWGSAGDGSNARMQMFIWTGDALPPTDPPVLRVDAPANLAGDYAFDQGLFGGAPFIPPVVSEIVLVDDGVGIGSDACEDIINGADIAGKIALIDRGDCQFGVKALKAENEGAIAVIICNNIPGDGTFPMGGGTDGGDVNIPAIMISFEDCDTLKTALPGLNMEFGFIIPPALPAPGPSGVDGDFDNGIIAHEYTHGISIRLTGGPSEGGCLSSQAQPEQAGEGWSDWVGLVMTTDEDNFAEEVRGIGTYAIGQPITGDGIRQYPYTRDMNINPHTYGDLPDVAVPHGVGSIWCAMTWDLYWNLVDEYGFDDDMFNGTGGNNIAMQLVIDGLKLQPCSPSFVDARDAILAADVANYNGANQCLIWETFARRGLGVSAVAGGTEAFDTPGLCSPIKITKLAVDEIDAGEVITYSIEVTNNLQSLVVNVDVNDMIPAGTSLIEASISCSNYTFANDILSFDFSDIDAGGTINCTYQLMVDQAPFSVVTFEDGAEAGETAWEISSAVGAVNWAADANSYEGDFAWFAEDIETESDQYLALAEPIELTEANPGLAFRHWYDTEATWDGGVVEISTDDGATWEDLGAAMIQNGYNGTIEVNPASAISGRMAFNGDSEGYIRTIVDLSSYSGSTVQVRFRFASDGAVGGLGWYVDNVELYSDLHTISNIACAQFGGSAEDNCDEVLTIVQGDGMTATNDLEKDLRVSISPNPTKGHFTLTMINQDNSPAMIQVLSVDGRMLQSKNVGYSNGNFEFDLSNYSAGVYYIQVQTDETLITEKVVVQ